MSGHNGLESFLKEILIFMDQRFHEFFYCQFSWVALSNSQVSQVEFNIHDIFRPDHVLNTKLNNIVWHLFEKRTEESG